MPWKNTKLDNKKPSEEQRTLDLESEVLQILAPSFCCINLGGKKNHKNTLSEPPVPHLYYENNTAYHTGLSPKKVRKV